MSGMMDRLRGGEAMAEIRERLDNQKLRIENQRGRLDNLHERLEKQRDRLDAFGKRALSFSERLTRQKERVDKLKEKVDEMTERLRPLERGDNLRNLDHGRMSQQVGSLEERLGRLEQRVGDGPLAADPAASAEAQSVVAAIRAEHEQIRIRMQIVSSYEERLRRVETAVVALHEGDVRDPV